MKLRRFVSVCLVFYLLFLQAESAFGHAHDFDCKTFTQELVYDSADNDDSCNACFADSLKPAACQYKAFFLESIYVDLVITSSVSYKLQPYSFSRNCISGRAPPVTVA